jgi:iron complex outermembrane recepter protein
MVGGARCKRVMRAAVLASLVLLWNTGRLNAQDAPGEGPLDDLGGEEGPAEEAPAEAPPADAPPAEGGAEGFPTEGEAPAEGPVDESGAGAEGGVAAEGEVGVGADLSLSADAAPVEAPPPAAGSSDELVVTGSRIKRTSFATPSAVEVVDRKALAASGAQRMGDVVKSMDINSGSEFNTDVSTAAGGTTSFNLRGLGLSSTLVLLNGRRLVQTATASSDGSNFVDINTIPVSAIERIEILKGGASAIYGSDAVAGVVNIITRKKMNGFEAQVGGQTTDNFDQREWDVALTGGATTDRTRVVGTLTYFNRSPLDAEERDFTKNGRNTSALGQPSAFVRLVPNPMMPMMFVPAMRPADGNPMAMETDTFVDPGCGTTAYPLSTVVGNTSMATNLCSFNFNSYFDLVIEEQRVNTFGNVEHDLSDHTTIFFETGYTRGRAERSISPAFPILVSPSIIIPPDHRDNPVDMPLAWQGRVLGGGSPPTIQFYHSDTLHTATGIKGDLGGVAEGVSMLEDWEWELSGTWGMNRFALGLSDILTGPLRTAVSSASCGPMAMNPTATCLNPFSDAVGGMRTDPSVIERINGERRYRGDTELTTVGADITGPLFELPGGDLSLAAGVQMRNENLEVDNDHQANQREYIFLIGGDDYTADRRVLAGYGELSLPFLEGLEVQAAGRVENYDDAGTSLNPMAGLSWIPAKTFMGDEAPQVSKLRLHGTFATTFRAPSLLQMYGEQTELREIFNFTPMAANPALGMQAARGVFSAVRTLGNEDLDPETATAITGGIEWPAAEGLVISADYWLYDYKDLVQKEDAQSLVAMDFNCNPADPVTSGCDTRITRGTGGTPNVIVVEFVNQSSVKTQGIDFAANYRSDFGATAGTFSFGVSGSYTLSYDIPKVAIPASVIAGGAIECSGDSCNVAGVRNFSNFGRPLPQLRGTLPIGWNLDIHNAAVIVHYISSYKDDFNSAPAGSMTPSYKDIDGWVTIDLQYSLRITEGDTAATTLKFGVLNLLGSDPPKVDAGLGYDVLTHDPRGRLLYARLIQEM